METAYVFVFVLLNLARGCLTIPCYKVADVVLMIDSSGSSSSIQEDYFRTQIQFVKELVKKLKIGPDSIRIAALTYSGDVRREFYFNRYSSKEQIVERIDQIVHVPGRNTFTHDALEVMRTEIFSPVNGARPSVPKICILLTNGKSTYTELTRRQALLAKSEGITIFAIGIGGEVNDAELQTVVSAPARDYYFRSPSFEDLKSLQFQVLFEQRVCAAIPETLPLPYQRPTTTIPMWETNIKPITSYTDMQRTEPDKDCKRKEADVMLMVDMSNSIKVTDFREQLKFLTDIVRHFDVDSGRTRVGMIAFSDEATTQFHLNEYKSMEEVTKAILRVQPKGGITNTHLAMQKLVDEMLTPRYGSRPNAARICILITDGRSSRPELTRSMTKLVRDSGVYVFTVGVGNAIDKTELEQMASRPEFAFEVSGYSDLPMIHDTLAYKACEIPQGDELRCTKDIQADIMFGLYGIGSRDRNQVVEFIRSVGSAIRLTSGKVRVGLRESCGTSEIDLKEFDDIVYYISSVNDAMETDLSTLLSNLRTSFVPTRMNAESIAVLVISGKVQDMDKAYTEVLRLKEKARVIVVGVGKEVDRDQLQRLATYKDHLNPDTSHVLIMENSTYLPTVVRQFMMRLCREQ